MADWIGGACLLPLHLQATLDLLRTNATDGTCQLSQSDLARARGVARCTLHRHIAELEALGYLTIQRRPGRPSIYRLTSKGQRAGGGTGWLATSRVVQRLHRLLNPTRGRQPSTPGSMEEPDSLTPDRPTQTVGREDILATLQENVARGQHTLLVGPLGIGKSHLLRHFVRVHGNRGAREQGGAEVPGRAEFTPVPFDRLKAGALLPSTHAQNAPRPIYLEHVSPIKPALLTLAERLHQDGRLQVEGIEADYMVWEDVRKKVAPLRVNQLAELVITCLKDQGYILILDHLERVTPTMLPHLDALMDVTVVIAATDELKPSAQRLWWAFEQVKIPPLTREQARELLWQVADAKRVAQPQLFETHVLQQAGGNPLAVITMAGKARTAELSAREIRSLQHGAGTRYVPLTPALMLIGALIVAARFVALGLNDRDLYVLAGLGYALFFFLRYFIYRID
ncbi:MAG: hypothetical protein D6736_04700 [Nitrospinota bacterium]|nr:MAG: hypothetical protein D6736_04700 [Nitrospinota bacterium]